MCVAVKMYAHAFASQCVCLRVYACVCVCRFEATILETGEAANLSYAIGPPFSCPDGCGGTLLSNDSVFYYAHGTCVEENTCECKLKENSTEYGYGLNNCSKVLCNPECKNGYCAAPDNCQCDPGWSDVDCGTALCNT